MLFWCVKFIIFGRHPSTSIAISSSTDQPIVVSFPHFSSRPSNLADKLEGIAPNREKHSSYIVLEPTLGVPLTQRAVSQSNIKTGNLRRFKTDIAKFSDMVIPMFWLEYVRRQFSLQLHYILIIFFLRSRILRKSLP